MLRRIRRRVGRLFPRRWLLVVGSLLISVLILERVKQSNFHIEIFTAIVDLKETEATGKIMPHLLAAKVEAERDWKGASSDRQQLSGLHGNDVTRLAENNVMNDVIDQEEDFVSGKGVNVHIWRGLCCPKVNSLRQYPLFPLLPKERLSRDSINSGPMGNWYGQRIMGYIHPPITGSYTFHFHAHVYAEFWLSEEKNSTEVALIAKVAKENHNFLGKSVGRISRQIHLKKGGKYFFDVLHVMNGGMMRRDHVNLTWKISGREHFSDIPKMFLSPLLNEKFPYPIHELPRRENYLLRQANSIINTDDNDTDAGEDDEDYIGMEIPSKKTRLSEEFSLFFGDDFDVQNKYDKAIFEQLPDVSDGLLSVLPSCSYDPAYTKKRKFKQFEGIWQTHFSSVFPDDGTKEFICIGYKQKKDCQGNDVLNQDEVLTLLQMLTKKIDEMYPGYGCAFFWSSKPIHS